MGTDIHMFVEMKVNGKWEYINPPALPEGISDRDKFDHVGCSWDYRNNDNDPVEWHISRHYNLFAILANVRNGCGFAGVKTGDGFNVIAMPRNFPPDINPKLGKYLSEVLEHTPTWLHLPEILAFDWTQKTRSEGIISEEGYKTWIEKQGRPESYSGGVFGGGAKVVSRAEMAAIITGQRQRESGASYYTSVDWETPYSDVGEWFLNSFIPQVREECKTADENIRLVFYFDS